MTEGKFVVGGEPVTVERDRSAGRDGTLRASRGEEEWVVTDKQLVESYEPVSEKADHMIDLSIQKLEHTD